MGNGGDRRIPHRRTRRTATELNGWCQFGWPLGHPGRRCGSASGGDLAGMPATTKRLRLWRLPNDCRNLASTKERNLRCATGAGSGRPTPSRNRLRCGRHQWRRLNRCAASARRSPPGRGRRQGPPPPPGPEPQLCRSSGGRIWPCRAAIRVGRFGPRPGRQSRVRQSRRRG